IAARFRLDEVGILLVEIQQRLLKRGQFEKVVFFGDRFRGPAAIGAVVTGLGIRDEGMVVNAVLSSVVAFVDITVLVAEANEPLHGAYVPEVRGVDVLSRRLAKFVQGRSA